MSDKFATYYEPEYISLSALSPHTVKYKGVIYQTAEHAYQALKFLDVDQNIYEEVKNAKSPFEAKRIKDKYKDQINPDFEQIKYEIMYDIFLEKAKQHEEIQELLIKSGSKIIGEASPYDNYRGIGTTNEDGTYTGENKLGEIRMKIRDIIEKGEL